MENSVTTILSRIDTSNLPVVPQVLLDLINATHQSEVNFRDLAKIIGNDTSLSSKVLATANSSFYRHWGEINDLNRVMVVLGINTVKTIALTRTIQQFFSQIPLKHYDFLEIIWYRSLTCAYIARNLAKLTSYEFPDEAYLTGLLHRIGQLVLLKSFPKEYPDFLAKHFDGQKEALEKKIFGATHNEVGSYLIETWNIQSFISDAVLYQSHSPDEIANSSQLVKIVNLSSKLACSEAGKKNDIFDLADNLFGLNSSMLEDILQETTSILEQSAQHLGITIANPDGLGIKCLTSDAQRNDIQKQFASHIEEIALTSAVKRQFENYSEINKLVTVLQRSISLLFGFQASAIFLFRDEDNSLIGIRGEEDAISLWPTITINTNPDQSLLAKALLKKQILHSFDAKNNDLFSIADRQIQRLLGTEGMLIIPLLSNEHAVGVIVSGISQLDLVTIDQKNNFLTLFAKEASLTFLKIQTPSLPNSNIIDNIKESYKLHARKLVHEANNPLCIINNYLHLLGQKLGEENSNEIRIIQQEIERVGNIVLKLPDGLETEIKEANNLVDVNAIIIDLVNLFKSGILKLNDINVSLQLDFALKNITSNRNKIKQIMTNLIKNSAEAMASGGTLSISTKDDIDFKKTNCIEIEIHDTGPGIPQEVMSTLFNPVTSTKGKGHSGLGLTICKNLVDELNGTIQCHSTPGKGTTFRIFLPREQ